MDVKLERKAYMQTIWFISRYWDFKIEYEDMLDETSKGDGIRGSGISNPTAQRMEKVEKLHDDIKLIEDALSTIPECLRDGILLNIILHEKYPTNANSKTYKKWKRRFVYQVAYRKRFI